MRSIRGKYKNKRIYLSKPLDSDRRSEVLITFVKGDWQGSDRPNKAESSFERQQGGPGSNVRYEPKEELELSINQEIETNQEVTQTESEKTPHSIQSSDQSQKEGETGFPTKLKVQIPPTSQKEPQEETTQEDEIDEKTDDDHPMERQMTENENQDFTIVDESTNNQEEDSAAVPADEPDKKEEPSQQQESESANEQDAGMDSDQSALLAEIQGQGATQKPQAENEAAQAPKTNYLKNTSPEQKEDFISLIRRIPLFAQLPDKLLHQIFEYAKFVKLKNNDRVIQEGMFDQEIYVLIKGKLDVLIKTDEDHEEQIDVIGQSFSLFGERCILGEQRGASIVASGDVTLLGIDLSSLPDVLDGFENPENRAEDTAYQQNIDMYCVFSSVLIERLDRLIKDQYKLMHKIMRLHEFQTFWENNILVTQVFNEFSHNKLHPDLKPKEVIKKGIGNLYHKSKRLEKEIEKDNVNTETVYIELVRLHSLGVIRDLNNLILGITNLLAENAKRLPCYQENIKAPIYKLPDMLSLADFLQDFYDAVLQSDLLKKDISKEQMLESFVVENQLNPMSLADFLGDSFFVESRFELAYIMYLACRHCIYKVAEINKVIGKYVKHLTSLNSPPMQNLSDQTDRHGPLVDEMIKMQKAYAVGASNDEVEKKEEEGTQDNVEDLLASYGM